MASLRCPNASSSSAKLFVQLSLRHQSSSSNPRRPAQLLDLLVPAAAPAAARPYHTGAALSPLRQQQRQQQRYTDLQHGLRASIPAAQPTPPATRRHLSTTPTRRRTEVLYNPQQDEDGKDMLLEITPRAAKRLSEIMTKDANPNLALRIQVESGACHGFQYLMSLVTLPGQLPPHPANNNSAAAAEASTQTDGGKDGGSGSVVREDDSIIAFAPDEVPLGETKTLQGTPKIVLDGPSLELLKGSKVDFTMELIGSQFKIVDNPLATSSCGCGTSFDIKI